MTKNSNMEKSIALDIKKKEAFRDGDASFFY